MSNQERALAKIKEAMFDKNIELPIELQKLAFSFMNCHKLIIHNAYGFLISSTEELDLVMKYFEPIYAVACTSALYECAHNKGIASAFHQFYELNAFVAIFTEVIKPR